MPELWTLGVVRYMTTPRPAIAKPAAVTRAIGLLCLSLGIMFVGSVLVSFYDFRAAQGGFFSLLIMAWLTHKTNQGRNWARIVFLALYVFGTVISIPALLTARHSIIYVGVFIIQAALQAVVLFMLFSNDARPWFRAVSNQPASPDDTYHNA